MKEDEFQEVMDTWAGSEKESAPDLHPTAEMVRLVRAKQELHRAPPLTSRWAVAVAAVAVVLVLAGVLALVLHSTMIPGVVPTPEAALIAQREGPGAVPTAIVKSGSGKGPGRGPVAFRQLLLETQAQDSTTVQALDLQNPPDETLVLTPFDNYRLVLEPLEESYAYVYQLTTSGTLVQLFPNPAYSAVGNPLVPGQVARLPAEPNWLYLDGLPGEERLYVVASPDPLEDLEERYARHNQEPDGASKQEILSDLLDTIATIAEAHPGRAISVEFAFQHR